MGKSCFLQFHSVPADACPWNGHSAAKMENTVLYVLYAEHNAKDYQQTFQGYALLQRA